jgi:hypothetical protein
MGRTKVILAWAVVWIAGVCQGSMAQSALEIREEIRLPAGNWGLEVFPARPTSPVSAPVILSGITNNAAMGLAITRFRVSNCTKDRVISLRLGWRLYASTDSERPLFSGVSRSVLLSSPLAAGQTADVNATPLVFAPIIRTLVPEGQAELEGSYIVELAAAEVCFEGGDIWVYRVWAGIERPHPPIIGEVISLPSSKSPP